jgi:hypothetical protein
VPGLPLVPDATEGPHTLREYAFVADGRRGALIDPEGRVAWLCFPSWADPAVFSGLLGGGGGYQVRPEGRAVAGGHYEDGSLIWHSRWVTHHGSLDSREALAHPGEAERAVLLRRVTAVDGPQRVTVRLELASDYGRRPLKGWRREAAAWTVDGDGWSARWTGAAEAQVTAGDGGGQRLELRLDLAEGDSRDLVLELTCGSDQGPIVDPGPAWAATEEAWRRAVPDCGALTAPADVRRSLAVLRGMTGPEGATVAAATTSLPERAEGGRNYDYRYCWIRDISYVGHAGAAVEGGEPILDGAVRWVGARLAADGDATLPAYLPDGTPIPDQRPLDLPGYPGGHDVVGNRVRRQFQLDAFGEALLLLAEAAGRDRLDGEGWKAAELAIGAIERRRREPDAGVWETEPDLWAHSRLVCAAGLLAICRAGAPARWVASAQALAEDLVRETTRTCLHPTGRWQRSPGDDRVDASLLLAQVRGAVPADDPRSRATRAAVATELSREGYVYRYPHSGRRLGEAEGAFLVCNFWMALACFGAGEGVQAVRWFERGRSACGSPGLLAEEFDVNQHQLRGNLPQAFVHALLVEAAAAQGREERGSD